MTVEHIPFTDWDVSSRVVAFSTTREGGLSVPPYDSFNLATHVGDDPVRVFSNRERLEGQLPSPLSWQWLDQVHGTDVAVVESAGREITADALLTTRPNLVCCVQTADCLPLLVAARDGLEIAAIHAGWKGLATGVIENTIAKMATPASSLVVWLGPAIGPCHFEVGGEVRECFLSPSSTKSAKSEIEACFASGKNPEKFMADLYAIARLKLRSLGIADIVGGERCTHCDDEKFYSYRRDGVTGRMLSAIYIEA